MTLTGAPWVRAVFHWWLARLAELLPGVLRRAARRDIRFPVLPDGTLSPGTLSDSTLQNAARTSAPRRRNLFGPTLPDISLILPPGTILSRDVPLPRAAAPHALQTIGHDLDRLTPFRPEDVAWSVTRAERSRNGKSRDAGSREGSGTNPATPNGQITFRLHFAPRSAFAPALDALRRRGLVVTHLRTETPDESIPLGRPKAHGTVRKSLLWGLAVAVIAGPFLGQMVARIRLDHALSELSGPREQAEALRHDIIRLTQGPAAIQREDRRIGGTLALVDTLTRVLPDDTALTDLHIHERRIDMEGQSGQATKLIGLLEHDGAFRDAAFTGPVTPGENHRQDLFSLHLDAPPTSRHP